MSTTKLLAPAASANTTIQSEFGNYTVAADRTVTVDSRLIDELLGAGYSVFDDDLPTGKSVLGGSVTVSAGQDTANEAVIVTGLASVVSFVVQILRAGIDVTNKADISEATGSITVADNSTDYVLTAGDVINWIAIGAI